MTQIDKPADTYATRQVALHWLVVGLVAFQFMTGGGMERAFEAGLSPEIGATGSAIVHGLIGLTILGAMLARIVVRRGHGAPPPPETESETLQKLSRANHAAFYVVLIAMPLAGLGAVLTGWGLLATLHGLTSKLLIALIAAHLAGAVWHMSKRDGVVARMLPTRAD